MKYTLPLLLLLALCTPAFAQKIQWEEIPTPDILRYLSIEPTTLNFEKFSVIFPTPKYGALEFKKTTDGKEELLNVIPFGPDKVFTIEIFLSAPIWNLSHDKATRLLNYKLTTESAGIGCARSLESDMGPGFRISVGTDLPTFFSYTSDQTTYTLSFISSDTPLKKLPPK